MNLIDELRYDVETFKAGRLTEFSKNWLQFTSDKWVLNTLQGADIELVQVPFQVKEPKPISFSQLEHQSIKDEIDKLLKKQVIVQCSDTDTGGFFSNIFLRAKKDGTHRMILDLSKLNLMLQYNHFKMECLQSAINLMTKDCFMASVDLKDAYYSVPIAKKFWKYLKFRFDGDIYFFTAMPNGLSPAPRIFTKLLKPIYSFLRKQGFHNTAYIDDSFLQGTSREECQANVEATVKALRSAGFIIHPEKSVFQPTQEIQYIGFILNFRDMTVRITSEKACNIKILCNKMLKKQKISIRQVAKLVGKLVAALPGVPLGGVRYRWLDIEKTQALKEANGNFEAQMVISAGAKNDISWWMSNIDKCRKNIVQQPPSVTLQSDASNSGWGGLIAGQPSTATGGQWSTTEDLAHINVKELLAAFFTLKCFCSQLSNVHVQLQIDNTTAVAYINNQGGTKPKCYMVAREMWLWAESKNINLSATFIPGVHNVLADQESRRIYDNTEWYLNPNVFQKITELWNMPDIDLFASRLNHQVDNYISWKPDPDASAVDAFSRNWGHQLNYIFPPFCLMGKVVHKIINDQAEAIVIAPYWTTQPWFSMLMAILIDCVFLLPSKNAVTHQTRHRQPPSNLKLIACRVSGRTFAKRTWTYKQEISSCPHLDHLHANNIGHTSESGQILHSKGTRIHVHQLL